MVCTYNKILTFDISVRAIDMSKEDGKINSVPFRKTFLIKVQKMAQSFVERNNIVTFSRLLRTIRNIKTKLTVPALFLLPLTRTISNRLE